MPGRNSDDSLNAEQELAVETIDGPLLIIAGAGSGKTRVITRRIAEMLRRGVAQSHILALTFTNKAAKEMAHRVKALVGKPLRNLVVSTFHAFGVQILREEIPFLGYTPRFSIYDQTDRTALIKEVLRELKLSDRSFDLFALGTALSSLKTGRTASAEAEQELRDIRREYDDHLKAYNAVDFDDLIMLPQRILRESPEALERWRARFRYVMVDEFQDTSMAQYSLLRLLASEHRNLCVVGDDDQSIYSWRGANYQNIMLFERDFPERKEIKLERNYRSTKDILEAANHLIAHNTQRKGKELWTGEAGERSIELAHPEDEGHEGRFIARTIRSLAMQRRLPLGEFGVLVRTNGLMDAIEEALLEENLPYRVSGGTSFFQRKEVKDVISYLRVLANPDDDVNLLRIINSPRRGIGRTTVERLREIAAARSFSLYSTFAAVAEAGDAPLSEGLRERIAEFVGLVERYRELILTGKEMAKTTIRLVEEINLWGHFLVEHRDKETVAQYKYRNVLRFIEMLDAWEHDPDTNKPSIYDYLHRITLITRDDIDDDGEAGKVNLMTIHAAKGLEFTVVFIAGVEDRIIPHARAIEEAPENLEEERRLFYVALTRARQKLFLSSCRKRRFRRETVPSVPSPFLTEIPTDLIALHQEDAPVDTDSAKDYFARVKARLKS